MNLENEHRLFACELREKIAWIEINQPPGLGLVRELSHRFSQLGSDDEAHVVILTCSSNRFTTNTGETPELSVLSEDQAVEYAEAGQKLTQQIENLGKPVIAAIDGLVAHAWLELTLASTWRIASAGAEFVFLNAAPNYLPEFGGVARLTRLTGKSRSLHLILTGEPIDAQQALQVGLIDQLTTDRDELKNVCCELGRKICRNAPLAIKYALAAVNAGANLSLNEGLKLESKLFALCFETEDFEEGTRAFLEKRPPVFKGK
jgi:enoyl-CoA hydratase